MTPMMAGTLLTSTVTGFIASATGKYKWMPISMSAMLTVGFALLAAMSPATPIVLLMIYFFIVGFALGLGSQILVLIVQNEFPHSMVGTATAANNFFRQIGTTLGTAIVGSVFTMRLAKLVGDSIPASYHLHLADLTPSAVSHLPSALRDVVASGYSQALVPIFAVFVPLLAVCTVLMCFIQRHPLATKVDNAGH